MTIADIHKQIEQGQIAPVYVLYGSQRFLMDDFIRKLSERVLDEASLDFNYESFDLEEYAIQSVVEVAETLPFIGEKRLIVAYGAHFLSGVKGKYKVEHDLEALVRYVSQPADYSIMVLVVPQEKLDERKKVVKLLKTHGVVVQANSLPVEQLVPWLKQRASDLGVQITDEACALLHQFAGDHMQMLANEMSKMANYVGSGGEITEDTVHHLIAKTVEQDVFKLVDQVVQLRVDQAFSTLDELLRRNEEPIKILFLLARQFRLIFRAKDLAEQGYSERQMSQIIGVHPYVCKLAIRQGRRFSLEQLAEVLDQLAELDYKLKTGLLDKRLALELFILQLTQRQKAV
ncbi:DNA polymerase-3 subunit delta [Caldalkalibacillus uzonensis]|uniref:DNA polymerase III subunit delta n=1 Tax=Caldalkalibacillus uzonensis TaxID=353224 RepID=A0ABU0CU31_9BACI|nr:DNA polymerase III subunit delta [Caldalkalibacillus uzonensis]MDQ0339603.1 DNA polymerase-3 subunit delta [Caldalkalibacillus uzonensis]